MLQDVDDKANSRRFAAVAEGCTRGKGAVAAASRGYGKLHKKLPTTSSSPQR
jgi:hypothetical protein